MPADTLVVSSYPPAWEQLVERTARTHKGYCQANGYDYHLDCSQYQDREHNTGHLLSIRGFIKFDLMLHFLPKYKYVVWIDADCLFTNYAIPIEAHRSAGVTMGYDHNGIHSSVFIAHSTPLVRDFFWACNNTGRLLFLADPWHEMQAMRYFSQTPPYDRVLTYKSTKLLCPILADEYVDAGLPLTVSQKYGWEQGDWVCNLAALPLQRRIERATEIGERLGLL